MENRSHRIEFQSDALTQQFVGDFEQAALTTTMPLESLRRQGYRLSAAEYRIVVDAFVQLLDGSLDDKSWLNQGNCQRMDYTDFHPPTGGMTPEAESACGDCPVLQQCHYYVLQNPKVSGIWAGTSERDRGVAVPGTVSRQVFEMEPRIFVDLNPRGHSVWSLTDPSVADLFRPYLEGEAVSDNEEESPAEDAA